MKERRGGGWRDEFGLCSLFEGRSGGPGSVSEIRDEAISGAHISLVILKEGP